MFRRNKDSTATTPAAPPRPSKEDLENPVTHGGNRQNAGTADASPRTRMMGAVQKINFFKSSSSKASTSVSKAASSVSLETAPESSQNPGKLKGVMQKVKPFKSTSQVSRVPSVESLDNGSVSDSTQIPKADLQNSDLEPEKTGKPLHTKQTPKADLQNSDVEPEKTGKPLHTNQNNGITGMMQKVNPFESSQPQHAAKDCETDSPDPGTQAGSYIPIKEADLCTEGKQTIWYVDIDTSREIKSHTPRKRTRTFRIRRILPTALFGSGTKEPESDSHVPQEVVEVETLELAEVPVPSEGGTSLDPLDEGMETLEEWNFEAYADSITKKHMNQNIKHVIMEGGCAGKALAINTDSLISTIQVLSVAGGAAKAVQVMSITTGVMSGLFLALDVFFLAKDSMELKKGAKTDFAAKIREVCKDLQDGLLELNRIKEQLQKTMDGIEVEVEEEEDDDDDDEMLKFDPNKFIQLEE